jgi:flagellar hook-associated protein 2
LNLALDKYINPIYGKIDNIQNNLKTQVSNINKEIDRQNILLQERKNELLRQFTAMESAVNNLRNLQGQLVALMPAFLQNGNRK